MISEYVNNSLHCLMPGRKPAKDDFVILFIHGFGGSCRHWMPVVNELHLERSNQVPLLFDLEGHGKSRGFVPNDIKAYSNDVLSIIKKFNLSNVSIIAHSLGGLVAQDFCLKNPGVVNKLILLSTAPNIMLHPELLNQIKMKNIDDNFLLACMSSNAPQYAKKLVIDDFYNLKIERVSQDLLRLAEINFLDQLGCVSSETLVVFGDNDKVVSPRRMRLLKSRIPNAKEIVLKDVGHYPHLEATRMVAEIAAAFLLIE